MDRDASKVALLAAALATTCTHPVDDPKAGFCAASRHTEQARRFLDLLRGQGYEVVRLPVSRTPYGDGS